MKMPKFETENSLFGYFWVEFQKSIVIFEISTLRQTGKFREKMKMPKFGTKNALFGYSPSNLS